MAVMVVMEAAVMGAVAGGIRRESQPGQAAAINSGDTIRISLYSEMPVLPALDCFAPLAMTAVITVQSALPNQ